MPLFFAISGYITQKVTNITNTKQYITFLKKKFIALIIPLLTWSLVVNKLFLKEKWNTLNWSDIQNVLISPGLWFYRFICDFCFMAYLIGLVQKDKNKSHNKFSYFYFTSYFIITFCHIYPIYGSLLGLVFNCFLHRSNIIQIHSCRKAMYKNNNIYDSNCGVYDFIDSLDLQWQLY